MIDFRDLKMSIDTCLLWIILWSLRWTKENEDRMRWWDVMDIKSHFIYCYAWISFSIINVMYQYINLFVESIIQKYFTNTSTLYRSLIKVLYKFFFTNFYEYKFLIFLTKYIDILRIYFDMFIKNPNSFFLYLAFKSSQTFLAFFTIVLYAVVHNWL